MVNLMTNDFLEILSNLLGSKEVGNRVSVKVDLSNSVSDGWDLVVDEVVHQLSNIDDEGGVSGYRSWSVLVLVEHFETSVVEGGEDCDGRVNVLQLSQ